jgi:AmiR/NasT family two-component response regulator
MQQNYLDGRGIFAMKEVDMSRQTKLETTVGDLVVALTDETQRQFHDERITYEVVAFMLAGLLKKPVVTALRRL